VQDNFIDSQEISLEWYQTFQPIAGLCTDKPSLQETRQTHKKQIT